MSGIGSVLRVVGRFLAGLFRRKPVRDAVEAIAEEALIEATDRLRRSPPTAPSLRSGDFWTVATAPRCRACGFQLGAGSVVLHCPKCGYALTPTNRGRR